MSVFDFISADDLDDLPHDDARQAFSKLAGLVQSSLDDMTRNIDTSQEEGWRHVNDLRHSFVNVIVAAAKRYEIEPFASQSIPKVNDFGEVDFRQFSADLDHYMTQLLIDNSIRARRDSVPLPQASKDKIRSYLHGLRDAIEKSAMNEAKRSKLLDRLGEFEAELEKRRLNLLAVTRLVIEIAAVPGAVWASAEIATRLANNVLTVVAEAKQVDDENRKLPPVQPPALLSAPRYEPERQKGGRRPSSPAPAFEPAGMDDDIPF